MCTKACVASVSVRFGSKERGTRVKDRAKNGAFFDSRSISCAVKAENPVPRSFFAPKLNGTLATQVMCTLKGTESMLFCYRRNTNEGICQLLILFYSLQFQLYQLYSLYSMALPQHPLQKYRKLKENRPNYSKYRDCLSMETVTLENKAGVSCR